MVLFTKDYKRDSKRIYEGHVFNVRVDELRHPNGAETIREVVEHNGGVVIVGQPAPDKVLLIRQYRYSVDEDLLELPAGRIEKDEDPFLAAKRELTEETGFEAESWHHLPKMYSAPGFCSEMLYMYLASSLTFKGKNLDHDEETDVVELTLNEAWELVLTGKIRDAKTIAGLSLVILGPLSKSFEPATTRK